jgi:hypothetical protein
MKRRDGNEKSREKWIKRLREGVKRRKEGRLMCEYVCVQMHGFERGGRSKDAKERAAQSLHCFHARPSHLSKA